MRFVVSSRGSVRRSTLVYAAVFCLAVVLYFLVRPEPAAPARRTPVTTATTTTAAR
jgi:hypothetical protein